MMNGGQLPTNQLYDIDWGALDHAFYAMRGIGGECPLCYIGARECDLYMGGN